MHYHAIDTLWLACGDARTMLARHEQLGLTLDKSPDGYSGTLRVGGSHVVFCNKSPSFVMDEAFCRAIAEGRPAFAVGLRIEDPTFLTHLLARNVLVREMEQGVYFVPVAKNAGVNLVLDFRPPRVESAPEHRFPLLRMDHLATVTPDLEKTSTYWEETLGLAITGKLATATLLIRQIRLEDVVLELLAANSADSPIHQRPPGLVSLVSWEVADVDAAAEQARAAGFSPSSPAPGPLPGSRISTIPPAELGGLTMQLLEWL